MWLELERGGSWNLPLGLLNSIFVKRKTGRLATGTDPLCVRIPDPLMKQIMDWAESQEATRSEAIRRLVEIGLKAKK